MEGEGWAGGRGSVPLPLAIHPCLIQMAIRVMPAYPSTPDPRANFKDQSDQISTIQLLALKLATLINYLVPTQAEVEQEIFGIPIKFIMSIWYIYYIFQL